MLNEQTTVTLIKKQELVDLAGEKAMIDFDSGKYYLMNETANAIWDCIQSETKVADIVNSLVENYDVERETCLDSVIKFIENLHANGFITLT